ncbi:MAG: hypothetical protein RSB70_00110 [Clostridium sp.]
MDLTYYMSLSEAIESNKIYAHSIVEEDNYISLKEIENYDLPIGEILKNNFIYEIKPVKGGFLLNEELSYKDYKINELNLRILKEDILERLDSHEEVIELYTSVQGRECLGIKEENIIDLHWKEFSEQDIELSNGKYIIIGNFILENIIGISNTMIVDERVVHGLDLSFSENKVTFDFICKSNNKVGTYDFIIEGGYEELSEDFIVDLTRREIKIDDINYEDDEVIVENLIINNRMISVYTSVVYTYESQGEDDNSDLYGNILYKLYKKKKAIPKKLARENIVLIRVQGDFKDRFTEKVNSVSIKFSDIHKKSLVQQELTILYGEQTEKIIYADPETKEERICYIKELSFLDSGSKIKDNKEEFIEDNIALIDGNELALHYDNPCDDIRLEFYEKDYLDEVLCNYQKYEYEHDYNDEIEEFNENDEIEEFNEIEYKSKITFIKNHENSNEKIYNKDIVEESDEEVLEKCELELFSITKIRRMDKEYTLYRL